VFSEYKPNKCYSCNLVYFVIINRCGVCLAQTCYACYKYCIRTKGLKESQRNCSRCRAVMFERDGVLTGVLTRREKKNTLDTKKLKDY